MSLRKAMIDEIHFPSQPSKQRNMNRMCLLQRCPRNFDVAFAMICTTRKARKCYRFLPQKNEKAWLNSMVYCVRRLPLKPILSVGS